MTGPTRPRPPADDWTEAVRAAEDAGRMLDPRGAPMFAARTGSRLGVGGLIAAFLAGSLLGLGTGEQLLGGPDPAASAIVSPSASPGVDPSGDASPSPGPSPSPRPTARPPVPTAPPLPAGPWPTPINTLMAMVPSDLASDAQVLPPTAPARWWLVRFRTTSSGLDALFHLLASRLPGAGFDDVRLTTGQQTYDYRIEGPGVYAEANSGPGLVDLWLDSRSFATVAFRTVAAADWYSDLRSAGWECGMGEPTAPAILALGELARGDPGSPQTTPPIVTECGRILDGESVAPPSLYLVAATLDQDGLGLATRLAAQLEAAGVHTRIVTEPTDFRVLAELGGDGSDASITVTPDWSPWTGITWTLQVRLPFGALDPSGHFLPTP
jgi:hypothetical protein